MRFFIFLLFLFSLSHSFSLISSLNSPLYRGYRQVLPKFLFDGLYEDANRLADYSESLPLLPDYKRSTHWYPLDGSVRPSTYHELAIEYLLEFLRDSEPKFNKIVGCEYWIQRVSGSGKLPIGFHVDKDESVASLKHYLLHPLWSSVFYLTNHGSGTLITNQLSPRGSGYSPVVAEEGVWSFPEANKFILFNGTLLHGVVGDQSNTISSSSSNSNGNNNQNNNKESAPRVTFLVNFWTTVPEPPNCDFTDFNKLKHIKRFNKKQIKELRKKIKSYNNNNNEDEENNNNDNDDGKNQLKIPIPLDIIDHTKIKPSKIHNGMDSIIESNTGFPYYTFRMELPGKQEQSITMPLLNHPDYLNSFMELRGRNLFLLWKNINRINIKKELELFKQREEEKLKLKEIQSENDEETEEEEEEEVLIVKSKKSDKRKNDTQSNKSKSKSTNSKSTESEEESESNGLSNSASLKLAAARAAKEALKSRMKTEL